MSTTSPALSKARRLTGAALIAATVAAGGLGYVLTHDTDSSTLVASSTTTSGATTSETTTSGTTTSSDTSGNSTTASVQTTTQQAQTSTKGS